VIRLRILLVEDERKLVDALEYILKKNKFNVDVAYDGITGQDMAETGIYDVIILDRMLPGKEGVEVLKYLRAKKIKSAVIFLTAKDAVSNRVEGLDAGADDYLVKPFSMEELLARIRALGRRADNRVASEIFEIGEFTFDPSRCEGRLKEHIIHFTIKEAQLLELLLRNKGQVLTKEQILERVWGFDSEVEMNAVEIYIYYIRKKLNKLKSGISIDTIRGVGYCLKEDNNN
jgi:DNA-binding response OmpR family regulator